ncbi:MAG: CDP-diacylglycerol--serine O-phosphatidyltransferase [Deltaproteobacteria bacterium]|nr:CDP-diacylglycerol--serine O-phosphatidyltransferase [Deltaproteobacteria bacterium]
MNLRKSLFILPNLFTLSSIFCGFYATFLCSSGATDDDLYRASLMIIFAIFFDTVDGRVARLTRTQSAFGIQIDSLADIVSFGIAPALLVHRWALEPLGLLAILASFAFVACGAIRLARFNVLSMTRDGSPGKPSKYILGLPIPGAAGILVSLVVANHAVAGQLSGSPILILCVVIALSLFMISTIKFRSFKDLRMSWRTLLLLSFAIGSSAVVALRFHVSFALIWLLSSYVAIGLFETLYSLSKRVLKQRRLERRSEDPGEITGG